ncbi:hypothetical protein [Pseudomonas anguilliseptica]|uniref:hypothetical protein n=1 Tax=Pseudomonas anguilliseptica TaxID=53406 RepID=UPI0037365093
MKSDWDDAPDYIRNNKKQSPWRTVVILGVGSAITWGLIALFAKPIVIDVNQLKQAIRVGGQPVFSKQPAQTYSAPQVAQPSPRQADIEWSEQQAALAIAPGQNSFNDDNYTPKQPGNIYTPTAYKQVAQASNRNERRSKPVRRERSIQWIKGWDGGTGYLAEWVTVNNYIDSTSVCANHRRGSIDYRECRKAAKQHYHEECRTWRVKYENDRKDHSSRMEQRYCSAANGFSPMG